MHQLADRHTIRTWAVSLGVAALLLAGAGCSSVKSGLQRDDVEQWYKEGRIDRVEYVELMGKIDAREQTAQTQGNTTATAAGPEAMAPSALRPAIP